MQTQSAERAAAALARARNPQSLMNIQTVYTAAIERGLHDAEPGVNVLTFQAWKGLGRHVRKGEKALAKLVTWIPIRDKETGEQTGQFPKTVAVFHISQTETAH